MKQALAAVVLLALPVLTLGHVPIPTDKPATDPADAIVVKDITLSQVAYFEVTEDTPRLWFTFDTIEAASLWLQLGVPYIDRLSDYRPAVAVLGLGLPPVSLPFAVPDGLGGVILDSATAGEPEFFFEKFTGTESWILGTLDQALPQAGKYYIVAYVPDGRPGKLWVAIGKRDEFTLAELASFPKIIADVRSFHEIDGGYIPCVGPVAGFALLFFGVVRFARSRRGGSPCCPLPAKPDLGPPGNPSDV